MCFLLGVGGGGGGYTTETYLLSLFCWWWQLLEADRTGPIVNVALLFESACIQQRVHCWDVHLSLCFTLCVVWYVCVCVCARARVCVLWFVWREREREREFSSQPPVCVCVCVCVFGISPTSFFNRQTYWRYL